MKLSVVLITLNEEENLPDCLSSVSWADEIIVLDSGSTDKTAEIAKKFNAKVYQKPFLDYASQKNEALRHASGDWTFLIDADERVTSELAKEIQDKVSENKNFLYRVKRETFFFNHRLRFSGTQNDAPIRLMPRGKGIYDQPVHEIIKSDLPVETLKGGLIHLTTRNSLHYRLKMERYIPLEIQTMRQKSRKIYFYDIVCRPAAKFLYLYGFKLGILDGVGGFIFSYLAAYYDFVKFSRYLKQTRK